MKIKYKETVTLINDIAAAAGPYADGAFLVGGAVRDIIDWRKPNDLDIVVRTDSLGAAERIAEKMGWSVVIINEVHSLVRLVADGFHVDISPMRGSSIEYDLSLRDFTINAMAIKLAQPWELQIVIDPFNGRGDLEKRMIRALENDVFLMDPGRLMRAIRLSAELNMWIESGTKTLMKQGNQLAATVSGERTRDELMRILAIVDAQMYLQMMNDLGILYVLFPELVELRWITQPHPHTMSALMHSLSTVGFIDNVVALTQLVRGDPALFARKYPEEVCSQLSRYGPNLLPMYDGAAGQERLAVLKLAALLHDVGKSKTQSYDDGTIHFYKHEEVGSRIAYDILKRLKMCNDEIATVTNIIRYHMRPLNLALSRKVTRRAAHRFFRDTGENGVDIVIHALADTLALKPHGEYGEPLINMGAVADQLLDAYFNKKDIVNPPTLLDGTDLIRMGMKEGPAIGEMLKALRTAVAMGMVTTKQGAVNFVSYSLRHGIVELCYE